MSEASRDPKATPQATAVSSVSGGINFAANQITIGGDAVGRDKITVGCSVEQVTDLLREISATFQPRPFDGRCPYVGLDTFTEDDADRFFGREAAAAELVARIQASRAVVIAGPSGSGKSSLVRAGLIPALRKGAAPGSDRWLYTTLTPGRKPLESLALAMSRLAKSPDAGEHLRRYAARADALHQVIESILTDAPDQCAVVFVDQFEEIFTQTAAEDERVTFLNLLTQAASVDGGRVIVLLAVRSDFIPNFAAYPALNAVLGRQFQQIGALRPADLVSAIARPAMQVGLRIDPNLIAQIVNDMQSAPGRLPLMQFVLKDLFDAQRAQGGVMALRLDDYRARDGVHGALKRHADRVLDKLKDEEALLRLIFRGVVEIKYGLQVTRRTARLEEFIPAGRTVADVKPVIDSLAAADTRLLTIDRPAAGQITVTLAHEKLIEAWPWLQQIVNENRDLIALQNQLAEDAQTWGDHRQDTSYLYAGARLAHVREQLTARQITLSSPARRFIDTSLRHVRQRQARQAGAALAVIVAIIGSLIAVAVLQAQYAGTLAASEAEAVRQRDLARQKARTAFLVTQALVQLPDRLDQALLLSVEATRAEVTPETRLSLLTALQYNLPLIRYLSGHSATVSSVTFGPGDSGLIVGETDGTLGVWDISNPLSPTLKQHITAGRQSITRLAYNQRARLLAAGHANGSISLWILDDLSTLPRAGGVFDGVQLTVEGYGPELADVVFRPDGQIIASAGNGEAILLWDVGDPQAPVQIGEIPGDRRSRVAFNRDGRLVAVGGDGPIGLWDVTNPRSPLRVGELPDQAMRINQVAFSPIADIVATANDDDTVSLWGMSNPRTPTRLSRVDTDHIDGVVSVVFSPDGQTLASVGSKGHIRVWNVADPDSPEPLGALLTGHLGSVCCVAFSPNGGLLASAGDDGQAILWRPDNSQSPLQRDIPDSRFSGRDFWSVAFAPLSARLALGTGDGQVLLKDLTDRQSPSNLGITPPGPRSRVTSVALDRAGRLAAAGGCGVTDEVGACVGGEIVLWDVSRPAGPIQLGRLEGLSGFPLGMAFSPDGSQLWVTSQDTVTLWDVTAGRAPDKLRVWTPDEPERQVQVGVTLSPDGQTLALGHADGTIGLWEVSDPQTPTLLSTLFFAHQDQVNSLAFSPDGRTLATGSQEDLAIIVWDVSNLRAPVKLGPAISTAPWAVPGVAFSVDGDRLLAGTVDGTVTTWQMTVEAWQTAACQRVGRNFSQTGWRLYSPDLPYQATCGQWPAGK
ncbi:MAG: WD40 repeat domain-containing protein [Chloroflexi bacterium]|nr:WD40 repeat domain-containing protein [Chloroflexota bacterium]